MKTLQAEAGLNVRMPKQSTDFYEARYWGCLLSKGTPRQRSDGAQTTDRTWGFHSRVGKKESLRQANRTAQKRGRLALKRQLVAAVNDAQQPEEPITDERDW